jgi:CubicO group peptidase (beta-lactamase class C family)
LKIGKPSLKKSVLLLRVEKKLEIFIFFYKTLKIKNSIILIALVAFSFIFFISGKDKAVSLFSRPYFVAGEDTYFDVHKIYAEVKSKELDSIFSKYNKIGAFNGTVIYAEYGREIFRKAYGYADFKTKEPLTTSSSFQLASVSKMFTAASIMILKEKGKLEYDDSIAKYIPEFPFKNVTIRHLLNHRSGLSNYMYLADNKWNVMHPLGNEDMIDLFVQNKPECYFQPDKGFQYNNSNYALLASIVERITDEPFEQFVKENIFEPLEMDHSFIYCLKEDSLVGGIVPVGVPGYQTKGGRLSKVENNYLNGVTGDKGVYSTVEDLFKFSTALDEGTLLDPETLQDAFTGGSPDSKGRRDNYGFGWRIRKDMDSTVYHFGWWKGFRTYFIRDMKNQKVIIVLTNTTKGFPSDVLWNFMKQNQTSEELLETYNRLD